MKFIFIIFLGYFGFFSEFRDLKAAERINIKFEGMSIPISINQLSKIGTYDNNSTEVIDWLERNGLNNIFEFTKFLEFPLFKQESFTNQILRSWMGNKIISELSKTIILPEDPNGVTLSNTIQLLLETKKEISTLDILNAIPIKEIQLDLDNLLLIIASWKNELEQQQNLIGKLDLIANTKERFQFNPQEDNFEKIVTYRRGLKVKHRDNPINLEIWKSQRNNLDRNLIIFMPGLGGDISNFRWIGRELSKKGWPIIFIDHEGSNSKALKAFIKGKQALPGSKDNYLYRLKDLESVISESQKGTFGFKRNSYILMGHSLGSVVSFLHAGTNPKKGFIKRCDQALTDFAVTNLSKLLQCQLSQIKLPVNKESKNLKAIVGFSGFGSLIWPENNSSEINVPVLLVGGTYDLITPLSSEQFKLFLSTSANIRSRFLIIEGASHFSPIKILNEFDQEIGEDIFKINKSFIGVNPEDVQRLSMAIIIEFLNNLEQNRSLGMAKKQNALNLNFHILGRKEIIDSFKN